MDTAADYQTLLGAFIIFLTGYWVLFPAVEHLLLKNIAPDWCKKNQYGPNRYEEFLPVVIFIIRFIYGVGITFPTCIVAARETPWQLGETMTTAGTICVVSQLTPWLTELHFMLEWNIELFLHHVFCVVVYANIIMAPKIHMIAPLYLHTASQLGDSHTAITYVLRAAGHRQRHSWPLYLNKVYTLVAVVWSKVAFTLFLMGKTIQSPDRMWDWIRAICLGFFSVYTLQATFRSFVNLNVCKETEKGPVGLLFRGGVFISRFNMVMVGSAASVVLFRVWMHVYLADHSMNSSEVGYVWIESSLMASIGFAICKFGSMMVGFFGRGLQNQNKTLHNSVIKGETYLYFGCRAAGGLIITLNNSLNQTPKLHIETHMFSTANILLVWDVLVRTGIWMSVGEEARGVDDSKNPDGANGFPDKQQRTISNNVEATHQLRMMWADLIILIAPLVIKHNFGTAEVSLGMFFAHSMVQILDEFWSLFNKSQPTPSGMASPWRKLIKAWNTSSIVYGSICETWSCNDRERDLLLSGMALALLSTGSSFLVATKRSRTKEQRDAAPAITPRRKGPIRWLIKTFASPEVCTCVAFTILQALAIREVFLEREAVQPSIAFENVKLVLSSPMGVIGNTIILLLWVSVAWLPW